MAKWLRRFLCKHRELMEIRDGAVVPARTFIVNDQDQSSLYT